MTMKRRYKSNVKYPLTISRRDIARYRGFDKPSDMKKVKRVRFADTDGDRVHSASGGREALQSPRCVSPKTSEYAYFKNSKTSCLIRETSSASNKIKPNTKDPNFTVSGKRAGPSDHLFISPNVGKYDEPNQGRSKDVINQIRKTSENVTLVGQRLFSSPLNEASERSENQCSVKSTFTKKRLKLRKWAAHTCSEVEKLHPKGFDLVSSLLSRLFPENNENNDSTKGDGNISSIPLTFHEYNNLEKELYLSSKRDYDKDLPKICSGQSSDIVLREEDSFVSRYPYYRKGCYLQDESMDPDQHLQSRICRSSNTQNGFPFSLPIESHRSSGSFHFKGLDEFGYKFEHEREPSRPFLEWESELGKNRFNSSIVNHDTEKRMFSRLTDSWNVDKQAIVDNELNTTLWSSSLFSNYYLESNALPNYRSNSGLIHRFEPSFDEVKCMMKEPDRFSLASPCTPTCISLTEDKYGEDILSNSNIVLSYRDQDWLKKKVWDSKPLSEFRWKCSSAADFSAEDYPSLCYPWQFPENKNNIYSISRLKEATAEETFYPLCEGTFNSCLPSPIIRSSHDTFINCPLLLNNVSHDSPVQELYVEGYATD